MNDGLTRALLVLTFVTGIVDAVTFVGLGQVFAAMETGNVIFLGLGIGGSAGAPLLMPLVALLAFLAGAVTGALLLRADVAVALLAAAVLAAVALRLAAAPERGGSLGS